MKVNFSEEKHKYVSVDNEPLLNFSTFIKKYKPPFDKFAVSGQQAKKGGNQLHILKGWNIKGKIAKMYGTTVHLVIEAWINYEVIPNDAYLARFLQLFEQTLTKYQLTRKDLVSEQIEGNAELLIAGTVDILSENFMFDLKTGAFHKKKAGNLKKPFNFLPNSPLGRYTLQMNYYNLLENCGNRTKILLYWNGAEFEDIEVPDFTEEQNQILINEIENYER